MPSDIGTIAAATAVLDYDLLQAKRTASAPNNRLLAAIALTGSAAIGDSGVDVFIDTVFIGRYYNDKTGFPNKDDMVDVGNLGWPAGGRLAAVVIDAPATNPLNFRYDWIDL